MKIITRANAIRNLKKYIGQDLGTLAKKFRIRSFKKGKQDKGWKGQVLTICAGLTRDNTPAPNGIGFELKSVSFYYVKDKLVPKETMAIGMINPKELKEQDFWHSHCWEKLKSLVFCAVMWHGKNSKNAELLKVTSLDFTEDDELIKEIKADYDFIRDKLIKKGFKGLTGKDGKWIQARTKGAGYGSISRAFYARKELVKKIFEMAS